MLNQLISIAKNTFKETIRQPVYAVIIIAVMLLLIISPSITMYSLGDDNKLLRELGLSTLFLAGLFIAIFAKIEDASSKAGQDKQKIDNDECFKRHR